MSWPLHKPMDPPGVEPPKFHPRYRCTAESSRRPPYRCRNRSIRGGVVCRSHGGAAPQVKAAAERRLERERIEGELGRLRSGMAGLVPESPQDGLESLYRQSMTMALVLDRLVNRLSDSKPVDGEPLLYGPNHLGDGAPHILVVMLGEWVDRTGRLAKLCSDVGIDVRRMELSEQTTDFLEAVIAGILGALGLNIHDGGPVQSLVMRTYAEALGRAGGDPQAVAQIQAYADQLRGPLPVPSVVVEP